MTDTTWATDADGNWGMAANWSAMAVPAAGDDVTIDTTNLHSVTHDSGTDEVNSLTVGNDNFAIAGGTLTVDNGASFANALSLSGGGSLILAAGSANAVGGLLTDKGSISLQAGATLALTGGGSLAAGGLTVADGAEVSITSGSYSLGAGSVVSGAGTFSVETATLTGTDGDTITLDSAVQFGGSGSAFLRGAITVGTTGQVSIADIGEALVLTHGATWSNSGTIDDAGGIGLGNSFGDGGTLLNTLGGTFNLSTDDATIFSSAGGTSSVTNDGLLAKTGGTGESLISAVFTNNGTVNVDSGTLSFTATGDEFGGTIGGAGTLAFTGGSDTLDAGLKLSVAAVTLSNGVDVTSDGDLAISGALNIESGTTLELNGNVLTLSGTGSVFDGTMSGVDALIFDGGSAEFGSDAILSGNPVELKNGAAVTFNQSLNYGGTYSMTSDSTLAVGVAQTLDLSAKSTLAGTIVGPGTLQIDGTAALGQTTLQSGQLKNTGTVNQSGVLTLGNGDVTSQATHHWNVVDGANIVEAPIADNLFTNAGAFAKTDATGEATVGVTFVDTGAVTVAGGTLQFTALGDSFAGAISGAGTIEFSNERNFNFNAGVTVTTAGWKVDSNADVTINTSLTYAGVFSIAPGCSLDIAAGKVLTLSGTFSPDGGQLSGAGTLVTSGTNQLKGIFSIGGTGVWQNAGSLTIAQGIYMAFAGAAGPAFINQVKGTVNITGSNPFQLSAMPSNVTVENLGLLEKTGSTALTQISPNFTDTGTISVAQGTLEFDGALNSFGGKINGAGTLALANGTNTLNAGIGGTIANLLIENSGTKLVLNAAASFTGKFTQNKGTTVTLGNNVLTLGGATSTLAGTIAGTGAASGLTLKAGTVTLGTGFSLQSKNWTVAAGAKVSDALSLTFAGAFSAAGTVALGATAVLTLTGGATFTAATVDGGGLTTKGTVKVHGMTLGGGVKWLNYGTVTEDTVDVTVGDKAGKSATIVNEAGAVFDLTESAGIAKATGASLSFSNAGTLEKTGGAGFSVVAAGVANSGGIVVSAGTLAFSGAITGTGTMNISKHAVLEFGGAVAKTQTVTFGTGGGHLALGSAATFAGLVKGFSGANDAIDFVGQAGAATLVYKQNAQKTGGVLTVTEGALKANIALFGQYVASGFHIKNTPGASELTYTPPTTAHVVLAGAQG